MKIQYDSEVDALFIRLGTTKPVKGRLLNDGVTVDIDAGGNIVGIEILDAAERLGAQALRTVTIEGMPLKRAASQRSRKRAAG